MLHRIQVMLDPKDKEDLRFLAQIENRSMSSLVRELARELLKRRVKKTNSK